MFLGCLLSTVSAKRLIFYNNCKKDVWPAGNAAGKNHFSELSNENPLSEANILYKQSSAFVALTFMQLCLVFMCRSVHLSVFTTGITENKWMILSFFISLGLLLFGVYEPNTNKILKLSPIKINTWFYIFGSVIIILIFSELLKFFNRRFFKK